jgi:hypothetical protein
VVNVAESRTLGSCWPGAGTTPEHSRHAARHALKHLHCSAVLPVLLYYYYYYYYYYCYYYCCYYYYYYYYYY